MQRVGVKKTTTQVFTVTKSSTV